ncbi:MAG: hypothetical protein AAGC55_25850 [Myxococcota bacterium]
MKFPDVDRDKLRELADAVAACAAEVERIDRELRAARESLDRAHSDLHRMAARGLAYARVYADGDSELSGRLEGLALARQPAEGKPKKRSRGRPKGSKSRAQSSAKSEAKPTLPFAGPDLDGEADSDTGIGEAA